jgi:conjugal transfer ATP-binding protein TraC
MAWTVTPRNIEACAEAVVLQMARSLEGLLHSLPVGSALQVLLHLRPAHAAPAWEALRPATDDAALQVQRQALARGLWHQDGATRSRLRTCTTQVTLRLPVPDLPPTLVQRLHTTVTWTDTASARLTAALRTVLGGALARLAQTGLAVEDALGAAGMAWQRQDGVALAASLAAALAPLAPTVPVFQPEEPLRAQAVTTPGTAVTGGWQWDGLTAHVLSLRSAPLQTFPGMLAASRTPLGVRPLALWDAWPAWPLTLAVHVAVPQQQTELTRLRQKRTLAFWQRQTVVGDVAPETAALKEELDQVLRDVYTRGYPLLWARVHVVVWGPPQLLHQAEDALLQAGRRLGLPLLREPVLGATLFLQTLPLGFDPAYPEERFLRRARRLPAPNLAHLLPLYGDFQGTRTPAVLYLNRRGEAIGFDHFDSPTAPHTVVVGTSGSGKSFAINHLVLQVLPLGAAVVILDRWASYDTLCALCGGRYITLDLDHPVCVNPFLGPLDRTHRAFLVALLAEMASGGAAEDTVTREERAVLAEALLALARQGTSGKEAVLSDLVRVLRDPAWDTTGLGARLARKLSPFYSEGPYAGFFDGPNTFALDPVLTVVELSRLREAPDLQAAVMFVLMHQLTVFFADPARQGQRKYLISDEAWALLQHEASARVLEEIARTFRKLQTCALFVSQQGSDFASPAGKAIRDNAGALLLFQQNPEEVELMRTLFDLTEQEVALCKAVRRRPGWSEAYLRLPDQTGGILRLVPDAYLRWGATQQPAERAMRDAAVQAAGGGLRQAVAQLAAQYPEGLEGD